VSVPGSRREHRGNKLRLKGKISLKRGEQKKDRAEAALDRGGGRDTHGRWKDRHLICEGVSESYAGKEKDRSEERFRPPGKKGLNMPESLKEEKAPQVTEEGRRVAVREGRPRWEKGGLGLARRRRKRTLRIRHNRRGSDVRSVSGRGGKPTPGRSREEDTGIGVFLGQVQELARRLLASRPPRRVSRRS